MPGRYAQTAARQRRGRRCAEGRRGTYASTTAASIANPAPTHSRLGSTVTSSARTEKRAAIAADDAHERPGQQHAEDGAAPAEDQAFGEQRPPERGRPAPSAARTASSPSRRTVRARIRFATFEHAMMKTTPAEASSSSRIVRAGAVI